MSEREAEFDGLQWFSQGVDSTTLQIVLLSLSTLAWGFFAGVRYMSRVVYQSQMQVAGVVVSPDIAGRPEWLETARYLTRLSLAVFAVSMLAVIAIEYWDIKRDAAGKGS